MDGYNNNPGAPQSNNDAGATQYIAPQESYNPQAVPAQPPQQAPYASPQGSGIPVYPPVTPPPAPLYMSDATRQDRNRTLWGIILVAGGILFLLGQFPIFGDFGSVVLLLIGGIFMYAYFTTKASHRIGFLIPGAILLGIGAGEVIKAFPGATWLMGDITPLTLGLGFCLIWFLERRQWWACIPGGILILAGLSSTAALGNLWPLLLIGLGLYLLYEQSRRRQAH